MVVYCIVHNKICAIYCGLAVTRMCATYYALLDSFAIKKGVDRMYHVTLELHNPINLKRMINFAGVSWFFAGERFDVNKSLSFFGWSYINKIVEI